MSEPFYFPEDETIEAYFPLARLGDEHAIRVLRRIYDRGNFDPGFGRELEAFLARAGESW